MIYYIARWPPIQMVYRLWLCIKAQIALAELHACFEQESIVQSTILLQENSAYYSL